MTTRIAIQRKPATGRYRGIRNGLRATTVITTLLLPLMATPMWTSPALADGHCVEGVGPNNERQPCDDGGGGGSPRREWDHSGRGDESPSGSSGSSGETSHRAPGTRPFLGWLFAPHVVAGDDGRWTTDPGYRFRNDAPNDLSTKWVAGLTYPGQPGVVSSAREGVWSLLEGYAWIAPNDQDDLRAVWRPGKAHSTMREVEAADQPGTWRPRPGYTWVNANPPTLADTGGVRWAPGLRHPTMMHVVASGTEGQWRPEAGYVWSNDAATTLAQTGGAIWDPATARIRLQAEADSQRRTLHAQAQRLRNLHISGHEDELEEWAHLSKEARANFDEQATEAFFDAAKDLLLDRATDGLRHYYGGLNPPIANARITQLKALGVEQWVPTGASQAFFAILRDVAAHPGKPLEVEKVEQLIDAAEKVKAAYDVSGAVKDGKLAEALVQALSLGVGDPQLSLLAGEFRTTIAALYFNATLNISADEVDRLTSLNEGNLRYLRQLADEMRATGMKLHDTEIDLGRVQRMLGSGGGNSS